MKTPVNPMHPAQRLADAPRCGATAKTTRCRCKAPALKGRTVCRMHGARGGAPSGPANGRWRHGNRTREAEAMRRELSELMAEARMTARALGTSKPPDVFLMWGENGVQKLAIAKVARALASAPSMRLSVRDVTPADAKAALVAVLTLRVIP